MKKLPKMTNRRKMKVTCLALAVLLTFTISPTLAWLSAKSETVVNYFSGGDIGIIIDESPVDEEGETAEGERTTGNDYTYTAGDVLDKDPTVTVLAGSEECYVYVCVDNELPEDLFSINVNTDAWEFVFTQGTQTVYRYHVIVETSDSDQVLTPVFTQVTVSDYLTAEDVEELEADGTLPTIQVDAYAVQADNLEQSEANELAISYFIYGVDLSGGPDTGAEEETSSGETTTPEQVTTAE